MYHHVNIKFYVTYNINVKPLLKLCNTMFIEHCFCHFLTILINNLNPKCFAGVLPYRALATIEPSVAEVTNVLSCESVEYRCDMVENMNILSKNIAATISDTMQENAITMETIISNPGVSDVE